MFQKALELSDFVPFGLSSEWKKLNNLQLATAVQCIDQCADLSRLNFRHIYFADQDSTLLKIAPLLPGMSCQSNTME